MAATKLVYHIHHHFHTKFKFADFFSNPTIQNSANLIQHATAAGGEKILTVLRKDIDPAKAFKPF